MSRHTRIRGRKSGWLQMLLITVLLLPIISAAKTSSLARIIGPMMGKRGDTEVYENDIMNRFQNQLSDIFERTTLDDDASQCPLDTLFLSLEPKWQDLILEIMRVASYEDDWRMT